MTDAANDPGLGAEPRIPDLPAGAWLTDMLASYGPGAMFLLCLASCVALPVPASVAMLSAGAIVATGGAATPLIPLAVACLLGAWIGDQIAFGIGRAGRGPLVRWLDQSSARRASRLRAQEWLGRRGGPGVFLSRWPASPLGPYVNFAAGAAGMGWSRFTAWAASGEVLWVAVNLGAGFILADQVNAVAMILAEATEIVLALIVLAGMLLGLRRYLRRRGRTPN